MVKFLEETLDEKTILAISAWSDNMITEAYDEAKERLKRPVIPNQVKVKIDERGNLTISFENPVHYPKYILNSFNEQKPTKPSQLRELVLDKFPYDNL